MKTRDNLGRFERQRHEPWTPENWDDGYIARGRMRVYRPDYPGMKYGMGYAERAHVSFWIYAGKIPGDGECVHHIDGDKMNDNPDNLELMSHADHSALHHKKKKITLVCQNCGKKYSVLPGRIKGRMKEGKKMRYCSTECLWESNRAGTIEKMCEWCGEKFTVDDKYGYREKVHCSKSCSSKAMWKTRKNK